MSGSILVKELGKHVDDPDPPAHYSTHGAAAWRKGVTMRAWWPKRENPYTRRYMRRAWFAGWDAMNQAIEKAK